MRRIAIALVAALLLFAAGFVAGRWHRAPDPTQRTADEHAMAGAGAIVAHGPVTVPPALVPPVANVQHAVPSARPVATLTASTGPIIVQPAAACPVLPGPAPTEPCALRVGELVSVDSEAVALQADSGATALVGRSSVSARGQVIAAGEWRADLSRFALDADLQRAKTPPKWAAGITYWGGHGWTGTIGRRVLGPVYVGATGGVIDDRARVGATAWATW